VNLPPSAKERRGSGAFLGVSHDRTRLWLLVALAALVAALGQTGSAAAVTRPEASPSGAVAVSRETQLGRDLTGEINRLRRAHGLGALRSSRLLARAASAHAVWLATAGSFTHDWPAGTPFSHWILGFYPATGYGSWTAGENLLWRSPDVTAAQALALWLASPPHRLNLLTSSWRELGVAVVRADGASGVYPTGEPVFVVATEFGARIR
jgi:uncharacterized protein YkwD